MKKLLGIGLVLLMLVGCSSGTSGSNVVEKGDFVKIDFVGKDNGKAFDGGTAKNYTLEIGSGSFVPGFEDQCIGIKKGETKTINITFPENYTAELAGKKVTFDVTVHKIYREVK